MSGPPGLSSPSRIRGPPPQEVTPRGTTRRKADARLARGGEVSAGNFATEPHGKRFTAQKESPLTKGVMTQSGNRHSFYTSRMKPTEIGTGFAGSLVTVWQIGPEMACRIEWAMAPRCRERHSAGAIDRMHRDRMGHDLLLPTQGPAAVRQGSAGPPPRPAGRHGEVTTSPEPICVCYRPWRPPPPS